MSPTAGLCVFTHALLQEMMPFGGGYSPSKFQKFKSPTKSKIIDLVSPSSDGSARSVRSTTSIVSENRPKSPWEEDVEGLDVQSDEESDWNFGSTSSKSSSTSKRFNLTVLKSNTHVIVARCCACRRAVDQHGHYLPFLRQFQDNGDKGSL